MSDDAAEQLEREAAGRRRAVIAAAGAAVLQLAAQVIVQSASRDAPRASPGAALETPLFYREHAPELIGAAVVLGVGYLLTALALDYLFGATRARRREIPRVARITAYLGGAALAVGVVAFQVIVTQSAATYLESREVSYFAAREIVQSDAVLVATAVGQGGSFALAFAFVLISLNAMRAGLLTRFMGILGVIVGVLLAIPQLAPTPIVLWFWLGALAFLFAGRWPGGVPTAWRSGRAEPWPTARELREERERQGAQEPQEPEEATPAPARRRRKKRR